MDAVIKCLSYAIVGIGLGYTYGYFVGAVELIIQSLIRVILLKI
jgi:ABC-type microcin C transport system permease subunit YejE